MLPTIASDFNRTPDERLKNGRARSKHSKKSKQTTLQKVDESKQDVWFDRTRQNLHCSVFCGGSKCTHELWDSMKPLEKREAAIEGLNSNWVGEDIIASQRPSTSLFLKFPLIQEFKSKQVTGVLNLQEKGEHGSCGPDGIYKSSGYSYNGAEDLMPHGVSYYEFPWPDMTAPQQDVVLRSVQVMDYHVKNRGRVLVHCHAGLGRTGLMIACYFVYSQHMPSAEAIEKVRKCRPGAIQTTRQAQFISDFEKHLWRLSQAFRVEISDALIDVNLFMQRQRLVLHGEQSDLYKNVPMFLHVILCRLLNLASDNPRAARIALESLGPSSTPDDATLSLCRIAINRRRFRVQNVFDVPILSFLACDWFRSMSTPALTIGDCDRIIAYKLDGAGQPEALPAEINGWMSKPVRHTLGMVTSVFYIIGESVPGQTIKRFAFRCLVDSFTHAFNPTKLRHSPTERELIHEFFLEWGESVKDMYFNYDVAPAAHRTIKRIALASSIVLDGTKVDRQPLSPARRRGSRSPSRPPTAPHRTRPIVSEEASRHVSRSESRRSRFGLFSRPRSAGSQQKPL